MSVPNSKSFSSRIFNILGLKHRIYLKDHRHDFTVSKIKHLFEKAGFKNINITSDFIPIPKVPVKLFIKKRKYIAELKPSLGHHIIAYAENND